MRRWPKHKLDEIIASIPCEVPMNSLAEAQSLRRALYRHMAPNDWVVSIVGTTLAIRKAETPEIRIIPEEPNETR